MLWVFPLFKGVASKSNRFIPALIALVVVGLVCLIRALPEFFIDPAKPEETRFDAFQRLEWMTYDWRVRQARKFPLPNAQNLGFVYIDDQSIEQVQNGLLGKGYGLLWPRHLYGTLVHELAGQGAEAIGLDIILNPLRSDHPKWRIPGTTNDVESDEFFAQQIAEAGNVILAAEGNLAPSDLFQEKAWGTANVSAPKDSDGILRRAYAFRNYLVWHPAFEAIRQETKWSMYRDTNSVRYFDPKLQRTVRTVPIDKDGTFASEDLLGEKPEEGDPERVEAYLTARAWHMGILLAARHLGLDTEKAVVDFDRGRIVFPGPGGTERVLPVDRFGRFLVNWAIKETDPELTDSNIVLLLLDGWHRQAKLLSGGDTNRFAGKLVVVGSTGTGSNIADLGATPLSSQTYYVSTHWNVANSFLTGRFISGCTLLQELVLILGLGLLATVLTWRLSPSSAAFWVSVSALTYATFAVLMFIQSRFWLPIVLPLGGGLVLTHVCLVTYRVIFEESERRRVKSVFAKLVSPNIVNELLGQENLGLGGARRRITVFFADVRGFTAMTDASQTKADDYVRERGLTGAAAEAYYDENARQTLETVNLYLATIADTIKGHNGTLDKYIGDCVMAFWGAPTPNEKHAVSCVRAAIDAQRAMHALNQERAVENERRKKENEARIASGKEPLPMLALLALGTGINTGEAIVGLMGSNDTIVNYTVFGREINLASRLEGVSGRGRIIIGETTHADLVKFEPELAATCAELDPVTPKGFSKPIRIFEVPWKTADAAKKQAEPMAKPPAQA